MKNKGDIPMEKLLEILTDLHPDVDFETANTLIDDGILDSFDIVTIVAEIDAEYDVQIPAEELIPENFNSAAALYALVQRLAEE
jgi:acyl carrier protein